MLLTERQRQYLVYSSWCESHFRFQDLPKLMDAAVARNHFNSERVEELVRHGYTSDYPAIRTVEGKFGGGLIIVDVPLGNPFLGLFRLLTELPQGEDPVCPVSLQSPLTDKHLLDYEHPFYVSSLKHETYPVVGKKVTLYLCDCTIENIRSDRERMDQIFRDRIYWAFEYAGGKSSHPQFEEMAGLAAPFCSSIKMLDTLPPEVEQETSAWFRFPDRRQAWFEVAPQETGAGFNFAALVYVTYHLRRTIGSKLKSSHLVSQFEFSASNIRINWSADTSGKV